MSASNSGPGALGPLAMFDALWSEKKRHVLGEPEPVTDNADATDNARTSEEEAA
jgi:hypothetical protein